MRNLICRRKKTPGYYPQALHYPCTALWKGQVAEEKGCCYGCEGQNARDRWAAQRDQPDSKPFGNASKKKH